MYAKDHPWADAGWHPRGYIDPVEQQAVGVPLTQRLGLRLRAANPWVVDAILATAFLVIALVAHFGSKEPSGMFVARRSDRPAAARRR